MRMPSVKQRTIRVRRRLQVRYGPGEPKYTGFSGNVSREGIMIRAVRVFGAGTELNLDVELDGRTYRLKGKVRWAREGKIQLLSTGRIGMGIRLIDPPAEFIDALVSYATLAS